MFAHRKGENIGVAHSGCTLHDPSRVMASLAEFFDENAWNVLVAKPTHHQAVVGKMRSSFSRSRA